MDGRAFVEQLKAENERLLSKLDAAPARVAPGSAVAMEKTGAPVVPGCQWGREAGRQTGIGKGV